GAFDRSVHERRRRLRPLRRLFFGPRAGMQAGAMKGLASFLLKFGVTVAIFVGIFLEFGGGWVPVDSAAFRPIYSGSANGPVASSGMIPPQAFEVANPAYPGVVGRLRARITGATLPPPRIPSSAERVCIAAAEQPVF